MLTDVGSFEQGKSPYGAYDMAGNVWEWTADWYDEQYYGKSRERNPKGPSSGQYRVLRGGPGAMARTMCAPQTGAGALHRTATPVSGFVALRAFRTKLYPLTLFPFLRILALCFSP